MKYYNIPIFLPEQACPFRCVYCNQYSIAGENAVPDVQQVRGTIESHLRTFREKDRHVEVAFFGGNFTGLPETMQDEYLKAVAPYLEKGLIDGIRCSTRPDYITKKRLPVLKGFGMRNIELGAQSTHDAVLRACGRGHTFADIQKASELILDADLTLGLQMMLGLPGSTEALDLQTANDIVALGAKETRIYPCLVIKDTILEQRYRNGVYHPLSLDEAIQRSTDVYAIFQSHGVVVLRVGLHPSEALDQGDCVAGPYHHNFAEMIYGEWWHRQLQNVKHKGTRLTVYTHPSQRTHAIGYRASNRKALLTRYGQVDFETDETLATTAFRTVIEQPVSKPVIIASALMPDEAKHNLSDFGKVLWLHPSNEVYPSISAHPDIYFFQFEENLLVFAPNTPQKLIADLHQSGVNLMRGKTALGMQHPETVAYNASGTKSLLVHNLKYTDERILKLYKNKPKIIVHQGYTRCNLIALTEKAFITSDEGISEILRKLNYEVLYINPKQIQLEGHPHGFFPGCCGVCGKTLFVCGNTSSLIEKEELDAFLKQHNYTLHELYNGPLTDLGSIMFV